MDWHRWIVLLLQVSLSFIFSKNAAAFADLKEKRLAFLQHSKCTYSYEVAVHTARGSKSTESDGYQLHALVSFFNTISFVWQYTEIYEIHVF